jgi:hypothetical protein
MLTVKEIQDYAQIRPKARAYLCYLIGRNIADYAKEPMSIEQLSTKIQNLKNALPNSEVIYAIDAKGVQITDNISNNPKLVGFGKGDDRSNRAYYYRTTKERRCVLTDPYPSLLTNELVVTAAFPIFDKNDNLLMIICVDIALKDILKIVHPTSIDSNFGKFSKVIYTFFSIALFMIAGLLFAKGMVYVWHFSLNFVDMEINKVFKATILITLSLAIVDLVKAIFEEEVLGKDRLKHEHDESHQTMIRFLGSIIIALSIEALMLVFKFALTDPNKLLYAVYLLGGIGVLIATLSLYLKVNQMDDNQK